MSWKRFEEMVGITNSLARDTHRYVTRFWLVMKTGGKLWFQKKKPQTAYSWGWQTVTEVTQPLAVRLQFICILRTCILKHCESWNEIFISVQSEILPMGFNFQQLRRACACFHFRAICSFISREPIPSAFNPLAHHYCRLVAVQHWFSSSKITLG